MQRYVETNKNDGEIVIADASMAEGPGISVKTYAVDISGNASNQGQGNAEAKLGEPVIMLPNTTYVLRITSLDTADQNINAYISWYEGWDDIVA